MFYSQLGQAELLFCIDAFLYCAATCGSGDSVVCVRNFSDQFFSWHRNDLYVCCIDK